VAEYTVLTVVAVAAVVALELFWFRTGIFATAQYWIAMVIIFGFQILVDGWLTKLSNPIVIYDPAEISGLRVPWDIPIEDFGFAFAMLTLAILLWRRGLDRRQSAEDHGRDQDRALEP
jgi:lycopene cyclase domain-containing protein